MSINDWLRDSYRCDIDDIVCEQLLQFHPTLKAEYIRECADDAATKCNNKLNTSEKGEI